MIIGARDYLCNTTSNDIRECFQYAEMPDPPGSLEFLEMALQILRMQNLLFPTSLQEALDLYVTMTTILEPYT